MQVPLNVIMWIVTVLISICTLVLALMKWNDVQRTKLETTLREENKETERRLSLEIRTLDVELNERFTGLKKHLKDDYVLTKLYENDLKHSLRRIEVVEQILSEIKGLIAVLPQIQSDVHRLCVKQGIDSES